MFRRSNKNQNFINQRPPSWYLFKNQILFQISQKKRPAFRYASYLKIFDNYEIDDAITVSGRESFMLSKWLYNGVNNHKNIESKVIMSYANGHGRYNSIKTNLKKTVMSVVGKLKISGSSIKTSDGLLNKLLNMLIYEFFELLWNNSAVVQESPIGLGDNEEQGLLFHLLTLPRSAGCLSKVSLLNLSWGWSMVQTVFTELLIFLESNCRHVTTNLKVQRLTFTYHRS